MSRVNPWKITGYKAGQNVVCKVSHAEPGGYAVIIPKDNLPGFLPTEQPLKAGEEVLAQYVCVSNSRILLQCRFGTNTKPGARHDSVNWGEQLHQIDSPAGEKIDYHRPSDSGAAAAQDYQNTYQQANYAQEFDGDAAQQGDYHFSNDQYASTYNEQQGQYATGQHDQSQNNQAQYDQSQYDQSQYDQSQYDQNQYGQNQYDQSQTGQQGYNNSYEQQPGFAPAGDNQGYQTGSYSPAQDYSQSAPGGNFGGPQNGGMQFKPSMPSDYAETQNSWSAAPNSSGVPTGQGSSGGFAAAPAGPPAYQAPVQDAGQYQGGQQSPPVSYQGPNVDSQRPYPPQGSKPKSNTVRTQHEITAQKPPNGAVAGPTSQSPTLDAVASSVGSFDSSAAAGAAPQQVQQSQQSQQSQSAYQSPGSYQGPAQTLPQYAPVIVPDDRSTPRSPEIAPGDDWGYAGQAWVDEPRLTPAANLAPPSVQIEMPPSEADAAFRVWAPNVAPRDFHLKRATDLVPPPFDEESLATFTSEEQDVEWLITDIEGGMRTGCVKAVSQSAMSRSAALLYKGRAVGCIYGRKQQSENYGTEQSLQIMLQDLEKVDTAIQLYDLPESVVLPMSALFLGYPVPREENVDARTYMDYMCNWFESKSQTACLAITFPSRSATSLCFIHEGKFCGAFYVEEQKFSQDKEFVYSLMASDPQASVEANILPPEMTSSAVRFGFNLSMARKKVY
jgi:hypothetical protein